MEAVVAADDDGADVVLGGDCAAVADVDDVVAVAAADDGVGVAAADVVAGIDGTHVAVAAVVAVAGDRVGPFDSVATHDRTMPSC